MPNGHSEYALNLLIKGILAKYYPGGVSLKDIKSEEKRVHKTPVHRDTIIRHLNKMSKTGEIWKEKDKNGKYLKRGKYHLAELDVTTFAYRLRALSLGIFHKKTYEDQEIDQNLFPFFLKMKTASVEEKNEEINHMMLRIFRLGNKIGALILFYILCGLDPENRYIAKALKQYPTLDRGSIVAQWLQDCMHWGMLLLFSMNYIKPMPGLDKPIKNERRSNLKKKDAIKRPIMTSNGRLLTEPRLMMEDITELEEREYYFDKQTLKSVMKAYSEVYPDIYQYLQGVLKFHRLGKRPQIRA